MMHDDRKYDPLSLVDQLAAWVRADEFTKALLKAVRTDAPPQSFIAAGAVRNLAWDRLHGYLNRTPLHDVDVVYHNSDDLALHSEQEAERRLEQKIPGLLWQVRNQARMHERNGEAPYLSIARAMQGWPETATAVGVRLTESDTLEWVHPWGLRDLFDLKLRLSPLCSHPETFAQRIRDKEWLQRWPRLSIEPA